MVQFNNVSKIYDSKISAVKDLNFKIEPGEFVFLIGPSGSGKTTVIKMLIKDENPTDGKIYFNDLDITKIRRRKVYKLRREIGVIFQDFKLIPDKTAYENVAFAMEAAGKRRKDIMETVPYVLDIVGLSNRVKAFPRQLSGGEQQRVAIARAISNNPKLLIADEPTGNLDPASAWDIVQILSKINNWGTTVIMSTHGTDIVNSLNKRVIQMEGGIILRDDNKGQYEMSMNFENRVLDQVSDSQQKKLIKKTRLKTTIGNNEGEKEKKTFLENKSNSNIKDILNPNITTNSNEPMKTPKRGLLNLFGLLRRNHVLNDLDENKKEDKNSNKEVLNNDNKQVDKISNDLESDSLKESIPVKLEEGESIQKKKNSELFINLENGLAKSKEINERKNLTDLSNHNKSRTNLAQDYKSKAKIDFELNSKTANKIMESTTKTSINKLDLPKNVKTDLKSAGFKYIEDIISMGPEDLSNNIHIDPEKMILIANVIKNFVQEKSNN